jgi:hypothetical protein
MLIVSAHKASKLDADVVGLMRLHHSFAPSQAVVTTVPLIYLAHSAAHLGESLTTQCVTQGHRFQHITHLFAAR